MDTPEKVSVSVDHGIRREGDFLTFDDKGPGFFPLRIITAIDNDQGSPLRHTHDFCELVYIRKGSAAHVHGDGRYPVHAGDCFFISPEDVHGFEEKRNLQVTNVLFYKEIFGSNLDDFSSIPGFNRFFSTEPLFRSETVFRYKLHLSAALQERMSGRLASLEMECTGEKPGYRIASKGLFFELIVSISRCFEASILGAPVQEEFTGKEQAVRAAVAFLEENYEQDIRLKDVVENVGLSSSRLSDLFKQTTGSSLFDYLIRFRLDAARGLLHESELSVKEISYRVGFHDPNYFSRAFTKAFGESPTSCRRTMGK